MTGKRKTPSLKQPGESGVPATYATAFAEIKERVRSAQYAALKSVNKQLVGLYWDIGRIIVERQAAEGWGKAIVQQLAGDLLREFPGVGGFSASNLWRMKAFHETYRASEKLAPLVREIAWSHNTIIMERCSNPSNGNFTCAWPASSAGRRTCSSTRSSHTELFKQFSDNPFFRKRLGDTIFGATW